LAYIKKLRERLAELQQQLQQEADEIRRWEVENEILIKSGQLQFQEEKLLKLQAFEAGHQQQQPAGQVNAQQISNPPTQPAAVNPPNPEQIEYGQQEEAAAWPAEQVEHSVQDPSYNIGFINPEEAPGEVPQLRQNRRVVHRSGPIYNTAFYYRGGQRVIVQSDPPNRRVIQERGGGVRGQGRLPQPLPDRPEEEQRSNSRGRSRSQVFNRLGTGPLPTTQEEGENTSVFSRLGPIQQVAQEEEAMDVLQVAITEEDRID